MKIQRISTMFLLCAGFVLASTALAWPENPTPLKLINGWYNAPFATSNAEVENVNGIVHFKGAIATRGTNAEPFVLPKAFRPEHDVYISVDMCGASYGRLSIEPNGDVYVQPETLFFDAQCFTSLDGASFVLNGSGLTSIKLIGGWQNAPAGSKAEVERINGIVHLKGAIFTNGIDNEPFVLPKEFRPDSYIFAAVDLCNATYGQLDISPSGDVFVEPEGNTWSDAQCFTSLDGVWFAANDHDFKPLTLLNGWMSEDQPAVSISNGVVYFQGAIDTSESNSEPFVLPASLRPSTDVYVPVALCDAGNGVGNGRLFIQPNGRVNVEGPAGFSQAQCLTSLDGASFVK